METCMTTVSVVPQRTVETSLAAEKEEPLFEKHVNCGKQLEKKSQLGSQLEKRVGHELCHGTQDTLRVSLVAPAKPENENQCLL